MMKAVAAVEKEPAGRRGPRYNEIILSSIEVFSRTNYEKATTAMLAKEAGVAEGTLYKYFPTKKDLFLECFRYIGSQLTERYVEVYKRVGHDPRAYLEEVSKSYFEFLQENPSSRLFMAFVLNNSFDLDFREELDRFTMFNVNAAERMIRLAIEKGEIRSDINPRVGAWFFVGGYFTMILMSELEADEFKDPDFISDLMRLFLEK
jgi:AcrR family transcriptional regulator